MCVAGGGGVRLWEGRVGGGEVGGKGRRGLFVSFKCSRSATAKIAMVNVNSVRVMNILSEEQPPSLFPFSAGINSKRKDLAPVGTNALISE